MDEINVVVDQGAFGVATHGPVLLMRFEGPPTVAQLTEVQAQQRALRARVKGGKVCMFTTIKPSTSLDFNTEARRASVVPQEGFFGSIVRSIMSGVNLAGGQRYPTKVSLSFDDASFFVGGHARAAALTVDDATRAFAKMS